MKDLTEVGAPILPPGMFYKVYRPDIMSGLVQVELRRRGRWFSSPLQSVHIWPSEFDTAEEGLVHACNTLIERYEARMRSARMSSDAEKYAGVHDRGCTCKPNPGTLEL